MEEAVLETFTNVKFIEGQTRLNQSNWQQYFKNIIQSGVYEGLLVTNYVDNYYSNEVRYLTDGIVFANGIFAKIETENGYTDIGGYLPSSSTIHDRLTCIRVYFEEEKAEIVQKTNLAVNDDYAKVLSKLVADGDESTWCTRNEYYWDIPIFYQARQNGLTTAYQAGRSIRHVVDFSNEAHFNPTMDITGVYSSNPQKSILISGKNNYSRGWSQTSYFNVYMDTLKYNYPAGAFLRFTANGDTSVDVCFHKGGWLNSYVNSAEDYGYHDSANSVIYRYSDTTGWNIQDDDSSLPDTYTVQSGETVRFRLTHILPGKDQNPNTLGYPNQIFVETFPEES